jgi:hypothetical protein
MRSLKQDLEEKLFGSRKALKFSPAFNWQVAQHRHCERCGGIG